jgi:amino acid permease
MVGNWKVNFFFGLVAFVCTFLFSLPNNTWQISIFRGSIGFILFFLISYFVRALFFVIISRKAKQDIDKDLPNIESESDQDKSEEVNSEQQFESLPLHALHNEAKTTNNL